VRKPARMPTTARPAGDNPRLRPESRTALVIRHSFEPRDNARLAHLCGPLDEHLRHIERLLDVSVSRRNEFFRIEGPKAAAEQAMHLLLALYEQAQRPIEAEQLQLALVQIGAGGPLPAANGGNGGNGAGSAEGCRNAAAPSDAGELALRTRRTDLVGRTPNQVAYLRNILAHDITFGIGPAGTGKTFLAVACAVDALERSTVQRVILTRPAVEAGERLGFLPGDLAQKVDPYLRPLYDALHDLMGADKVAKAFERGTLEIAPLAFMRGRTLNHAFVILDEAQNSTPEQMKMFLTRIGFGTRAVINGDVSQIDLPRGTESGLIDAERVLRRVRGIATTRFTSSDVVRHPLVARIVEAYDAARLDGA
jgi:phosphate starvation-inducible protein PhoH and related proteins